MSDKKFKPTREQIKLVYAWIELPPFRSLGSAVIKTKVTNETLGRACGVTEKSIRNWFRKVPFCDWFYGELDKYVRSDLSRVWKSVFLGATSGDIGAAKLYIERFDRDYKPTTKQEIAHSLPTVSIGDGSRVQGAVSRFEELRRTGVN